MAVRIDLHRSSFESRERRLLETGEFTVSAFRYDSGIEALRVCNARGEIIVLPFKGQQIWRAGFDGRDLTMRSMFDEPVDTQVYLETYGAFMIHCGLAGLGAPGPDDTHPLHGELPNAPFQKAWLVIDEGEGTLVVGGSYRHTVAFSTNYLATANLVTMCEALVTSKMAGMDMNTAFEAIKISSGNSFVHETEGQVILNGSRDINFTMDLVLKDIGLFQEVADRANVPLEISPLLIDIFKDGQERYGPREWSPNIIKRLEEAVGVDILAPGFPAEMLDDEPEEPGYEVIPTGVTR